MPVKGRQGARQRHKRHLVKLVGAQQIGTATAISNLRTLVLFPGLGRFPGKVVFPRPLCRRFSHARKLGAAGSTENQWKFTAAAAEAPFLEVAACTTVLWSVIAYRFRDRASQRSIRVALADRQLYPSIANGRPLASEIQT